jgi:hypothetical protein
VLSVTRGHCRMRYCVQCSDFRSSGVSRPVFYCTVPYQYSVLGRASRAVFRTITRTHPCAESSTVRNHYRRTLSIFVHLSACGVSCVPAASPLSVALLASTYTYPVACGHVDLYDPLLPAPACHPPAAPAPGRALPFVLLALVFSCSCSAGVLVCCVCLCLLLL